MSYWVKAIVGFGLLVAGIGAFLYALYELMKTGTCSSGGPYVTVRECPEGTFGKALLIPGGLTTALIGTGVFGFRGQRPGASPGGFRLSGLLVFWCGLFIGAGIVAVVADMQVDEPGADWVGIFLAAMFVPMGLVPLLYFIWPANAKEKRRRRRKAKARERKAAAAEAAVRPAPPAHATKPPGSPERPPSDDALDRLRQLAELRDGGVLSEEEFAAAKSRILAGI